MRFYKPTKKAIGFFASPGDVGRNHHVAGKGISIKLSICNGSEDRIKFENNIFGIDMKEGNQSPVGNLVNDGKECIGISLQCLLIGFGINKDSMTGTIVGSCIAVVINVKSIILVQFTTADFQSPQNGAGSGKIPA